MCGRFTLASDIDTFLRDMGLELPDALAHPRRYNIAPSQPVLGIVADPTPRIEVMEWGFLPVWAKPDTKQVINARVESIAEKKPYYRGAFRSARCAIIADGFYEWRKAAGGKRPYRIGLRDGGIFTMAGLWSRVNSGDGSERHTCAIVTVEANEMMRDLHDRMPAILQPEDLAVWLDPNAKDRELLAAVEPYPSSLMDAYEVSTMVNSPSNDSPGCIRPITDDEA